MTQKQNFQCDCCSFSISDDSSDECPRCGYPIHPSQEIEFLESTLKTLASLIARGGGNARVAGLTHLSEAMLDELQHLAKYGGANLRLSDLLQFSPWVVEGLRRIKLPGGPDMRIPELIFTLERSTQWLRMLTAQEWQQVQVAGVIQLSRSTIEQIQRIVGLQGSELRVAGIAHLTPSNIQDLRRMVTYVRPDIKTSELIDFYQSRLADLRAPGALQTQEDQSKKTADLPLSTVHSQPIDDISVQKQKAPQIAPQFTFLPLSPVTPPLPPVATPLVGVPSPTGTPAIASEPARTSTRGVATGRAPAPARPAAARKHAAHRARQPRESQALRARVGMSEKLKTFMADSKAFMADSKMILTLLGAFLSLMAALFLVLDTFRSHSNITLALVVVVIAQVFFLGASIMTQRYTRFLPIARIYAFVFALLIPGFGFELYNLLGGRVSASPQWLIAIFSLYIAISFCLFAIYQKYHPFGYFGMVALWVADIATANALNVGFEWYPVLLMLLTLPFLISARQHVSSATSNVATDSDSTAIKIERLMAASPAVLRKPVKYCMYILVAFCSLSIFPLAFLSVDPGGASMVGSRIAALITPGQAPFALFCMFALLLIWYSLYLWLAKKQTGQLGLAWLFLFSSLAFGYSLQFSPVGYTLVFAGLAILYHIVGTRFIASSGKPASAAASSRKIASPERLALRLDQFVLIFICIIPFTSAPVAIPLFVKEQGAVSLPFFSAYLQSYSPLLSSPALSTLLALFLGTALTVSIAIHRNALALARQRSANNSAGSQIKSGWPWLLLLAGLLLCWTYSVLIVNLPGAPAWWFLGLTLALVAITAVARQRAGSSWANPLDIVALCVAITTILLNVRDHQTTSNLLLFFAALFYIVLLLQSRQKALFLPLLFALSALPVLIGQLPVVSLLALLDASSVLAHPPVILLCALTLPFVAALVQRLKVASKPLSPVAKVPTPLAISWQGPITCFSLLCACILLYHDAIAPSISFTLSAFSLSPSISFTHSVVSPVISIEIAILSLVWYGCAALTRTKWLLFSSTVLAIVALLLNTSNFWLLAAITVVAALSGLSISRLSRRIWAAPLYTTALLGAALTGIAGNTQADAFLSSAAWVLLGFVVVVHIVAIVEGLTPLLWFAPVLMTWSVIDTLIFQHSHITRFPQNLLDLARVPGLALVSVAAGVAIGLAFRRANALPAQTNKRLQYTAPLYTSALIAAILTGCYALYLETTYPPTNTLIGTVSLALPALLLLYAAIASVVSRFERQGQGSWLVAGFGIWGILLTMQINMYLVVGIGVVTGIVGLATGMFRRLKSTTATPLPDAIDLLLSSRNALKETEPAITGLRDILKAFTWSWPWYIMTVVAAIVTGLRPYLGMVSPANGAIEYSLLAFAALMYITGWREKQTLIAFFAMSFSVWAFLNLAGFNLYAFNFSAPARPQLLGLLALLCIGAGVAIRLPGFMARGFPARAVTGQQDRTLHFTLPVYITALVAAILTGVAPHSLSGLLPAILLGYAIISYGVIVFERRPGLLFIPAGFAAWGTLLISQNTAVLVVGLVSAPIGMLIKQRIGRSAPAAGRVRIWQKLLHTWAWPWYVTTLIAAITTGLHHQTTGEWLSPANSLLVFAALAYIIGLVEDLTIWLWIGPSLAIWSLLDSFTSQPPDPLRLISMVVICALLGVVIRRSTFLFKQRAVNLLAYALPCYTTALVAAILAGLYGAGLRGVPAVPLVSQHLPSSLALAFYSAVLFLFALIAYVVLLYERHPAWLGLVVAFGTWATLFVSLPEYMLAIGIMCGVFGLFFKRVIRTTPSGSAFPASLQSLLQPFIRFAWAWPWYITMLVAAIATGMHTPTTGGWFSTTNSLLIFAALACIIGLVDGLIVSLWIGSSLAIWSLLDSYNAQPPDPLRLISMAVIYIALGVVIRRSKFLLKQRAGSLFTYALPFYITALAAAVLTGLYGTNAKTMPDIPLVSQYLPPLQASTFYSLVLLVYALIAFLVLFFEKRALWLALVAAFGIWATMLVSPVSPVYALAIGMGSGVFGLLLRKSITVIPSGNALPGSLQSLLQPFIRFTWSWPWYGIALMAGILTGISQPPLATENTLMLFAILAYVIGLVEDQPGILYVAVVFAFWSAGNSSSQSDLLRLFLDTVCFVAVAIAIGFYGRLRFPHDQRRILFRYVLPLYALALYVAVMTGLTGTIGMAPAVSLVIFLPGGIRLSDASLMLLFYTALAYGVLRLERRPLWTAIVALFGLWGTILAIRTGTSPLLLLAVGLGAGLMGTAHAWRAFARVTVPASSQFDETLNIDNI